MKTIYSIEATIKYPNVSEKEHLHLEKREQELKDAINLFNEKHYGSKVMEFSEVGLDTFKINLISNEKLDESNMGKEITYLSRTLKNKYGWNVLAKYNNTFLSIVSLEKKNVGRPTKEKTNNKQKVASTTKKAPKNKEKNESVDIKEIKQLVNKLNEMLKNA